jgi:hypothetical protein
LIHAIPLLVEAMLYVLKEDLLDHVSASPTILEIHMLVVDLNVRPTVNVHQRKHVKTCIVLIHVLKLAVGTTPNVKWSITFQIVFVYLVTLETPSLHVACHHSVSFIK